MDVSKFTDGSCLCKNTMVFATEHHGYLPPLGKVETDDTISDPIPACLVRHVCCIPVGVMGFFCAGWCCLIEFGNGQDGKESANLCHSVAWWVSNTVCFDILKLIKDDDT